MKGTAHLPGLVPHVSIFIREELIARRWTRNRLACEMGGDFAVNRVALDFCIFVGPADANLLLGDEMSAQLGKAFGVSAGLFARLDEAWRCGLSIGGL